MRLGGCRHAIIISQIELQSNSNINNLTFLIKIYNISLSMIRVDFVLKKLESDAYNYDKYLIRVCSRLTPLRHNKVTLK